MTTDFTSRLAFVASQMETVLDGALPKPEGAQSIVIDAMRYAALGGGKRLRPFLMVETARMLGLESGDVWQAAAALECVHVYSLVHDDLPCMDDDDMRRGRPTVHKKYTEAMAVLAGDALLTHAFELIAGCGVENAIRIDLMSGLAKSSGARGMIGGQVLDILAETASEPMDETAITHLQALKTGALIEYAVYAGAILSGVTEKQKEALLSYARDLGLAFQITDDILDVEGDAAVVGKAVGKDENLGKATFVSILGLDGAREKAASIGARAKCHLDPFGEKANILCATVDFVLGRRN
ncbi:MAG: polyprenyl synthetase family protein [Alphaproteobacteria bacterium]